MPVSSVQSGGAVAAAFGVADLAQSSNEFKAKRVALM
jgi:hypothetical protein